MQGGGGAEGDNTAAFVRPCYWRAAGWVSYSQQMKDVAYLRPTVPNAGRSELYTPCLLEQKRRGASVLTVVRCPQTPCCPACPYQPPLPLRPQRCQRRRRCLHRHCRLSAPGQSCSTRRESAWRGAKHCLPGPERLSFRRTPAPRQDECQA
jgi:hypothetical protein